MPEHEFQNGAAIDTRPEERKLKDFFFAEAVATANPVNWVEKAKSDWRRFPVQDQNGSGSCVMQTIRKSAGVLLSLKENYVPFSAAYYQLRSNKPAAGMIGVEAFDIWMKHGLPLEQLVPSEKMTDAQMDAIKVEQYEKDIAKVFAIGGHIGIPNGDFETVASVIQTTGKAVMVWFYFTSQEWSQEIPTIINPNLTIETGNRHSVAAVDCFLFGGKKYLLVEDSAHFGGHTYHLISEEFFKARNWFARYPVNFKFAEPTPEVPKPFYHFTMTMEFGETSPHVVKLQDILKYEGLFPINSSSTGYYGAITAKAVLSWQKKHSVAPVEELDALGGRRVGAKTISKLNELYG